MKALVLPAVLSSLFISINCAYAIDIQPGEWTMENVETRMINTSTGKTLIEDKNPGELIHLCYTQEMSDDSKNIIKGTSATADGCTTTFTESTDAKLVNENTCNDSGTKTHSIVETAKVSDTELLITTKMEIDSPDQKITNFNKVAQKLVSKTCSEASKGAAEK